MNGWIIIRKQNRKRKNREAMTFTWISQNRSCVHRNKKQKHGTIPFGEIMNGGSEIKCCNLKVCRQRRTTFLFLLCQRFLRHFSTDLDEIWHVYSPWWDKEPEYNIKSIRPGVGKRRGPKVLLCFIIGKLYILRVEIRISLREENFNEE